MISTQHDKVTEITALWAREAVKRISDCKHEIVEIFGSGAIYHNVKILLSEWKDDIALVIFYGHGHPSMWADNNGKSIISVKDAYLLRRKIVFALTCESASHLGVAAWENGAITFFGYDRPVFLPYQTERSTNFLEFFRKPDEAQLWASIENIMSTGASSQISYDQYTKEVVNIERGQEDLNLETREANALISQLLFNRDSLAIIGDLDVYINDDWAIKMSQHLIESPISLGNHMDNQRYLRLRDRLYGRVIDISPQKTLIHFFDQIGNDYQIDLPNEYLLDKIAERERTKAQRVGRKPIESKLRPVLNERSVLICEIFDSVNGVLYEYEAIPPKLMTSKMLEVIY